MAKRMYCIHFKDSSKFSDWYFWWENT